MLLPVGLTNMVTEKPGRKEPAHLQFKIKQNSSRRFEFRNLIPFGERLETSRSFLWGAGLVCSVSVPATLGSLCCLQTHQLCVEHLCTTLNNQKQKQIEYSK